ncbi:lysine methyltransferase [Podospora aff. communis PSN243]|uniref:Lysine methyltransferase n=1 Tax=Podospora aff. communis PSN243 TaxID=3040156 RepID=A0AAV9G699_9PEZI|nr:lysine methyltransferase [Podospora aff. communis PSN243]
MMEMLYPNYGVLNTLDGEQEMYRVADIPGKGIGLIAKRAIARGERIMGRLPSFMVQVKAQARIKTETRDTLYSNALNGIQSDTQSKLMSMTGLDLGDKVDKNCFRIRLGGTSPSGTLDKRWGFHCTCAHCTMSGKQAAESDARLRAIAGLERDLETLSQMLVIPETGAQLVELYRQEHLDIYLERAYRQAALNYAAFGMVDETKLYAGLAMEAANATSDADGELFRVVERLSENPESHWVWNYRRTMEF